VKDEEEVMENMAEMVEDINSGQPDKLDILRLLHRQRNACTNDHLPDKRSVAVLDCGG
jgi:hypothetical protein